MTWIGIPGDMGLDPKVRRVGFPGDMGLDPKVRRVGFPV